MSTSWEASQKCSLLICNAYSRNTGPGEFCSWHLTPNGIRVKGGIRLNPVLVKEAQIPLLAWVLATLADGAETANPTVYRLRADELPRRWSKLLALFVRLRGPGQPGVTMSKVPAQNGSPSSIEWTVEEADQILQLRAWARAAGLDAWGGDLSIAQVPDGPVESRRRRLQRLMEGCLAPTCDGHVARANRFYCNRHMDILEAAGKVLATTKSEFSIDEEEMNAMSSKVSRVHPAVLSAGVTDWVSAVRSGSWLRDGKDVNVSSQVSELGRHWGEIQRLDCLVLAATVAALDGRLRVDGLEVPPPTQSPDPTAVDRTVVAVSNPDAKLPATQ